MAEAVAELTDEQVLAKAAELKDQPRPVETDEKKEPASSAETKDTPAKTEEKKSDAKAEAKAEEKPESEEVKALKAELARVRGQKRSEKDEEVVNLRERLAKAEGQLDTLTKTDKKTERTYTRDELLTMKVDWTEVLAEGKGSGETEKVQQAKGQLLLIEKELEKQATQARDEAAKVKVEEDAAINDLVHLYEEGLSYAPELNDRDSDFWKAAKAVYDKHTHGMKRLGGVGDLLAAAIVVLRERKNGTTSEAKARKDMANELETKVETALLKGSGGATTKPKLNVDTMSKADIEAIAEKLKSGQPISWS